MQLKLLRDQKEKGMLGKKVHFILNAKLQFNQEEADAINKYKLSSSILHYDEGNSAMTITLASLSQAGGQTFDCTNLNDIVEVEEIVREACETAHNHLSVAMTFGGEEIIDF